MAISRIATTSFRSRKSALFYTCIIGLVANGASCAQSVTLVPKPSCGPGDQTEAVQGQTTLAERFRPGPARAYNCNLELVGQFEGEGASADVEVFDRCAYYSTASMTPNPDMANPVAVLDVSDSRKPKVTSYLSSPAMLGAQESLEINDRTCSISTICPLNSQPGGAGPNLPRWGIRAGWPNFLRWEMAT